MKLPPVFLALHSAGVLSYLDSATASWASAADIGQTRGYFVPAVVPSASGVEVEETPTRLLTDRQLSPLYSHATAQRRAYPWQSSFYTNTPELYDSYGYSPSVQNRQRLLRPSASVTSVAWEGGGDLRSTTRSAKEINEFSHLKLPVRNYSTNAEYDENSQLPGFYQEPPVSTYASGLRAEPLLYHVRLMREEEERSAAAGQEKKMHQGDRAKKDDVEAEKKKKKKKKKSHWADERSASWEEQSVEEKKVQHGKKHEVKAEEEWKAKQYGDIGGAGEGEERGEGGAEEKYSWKVKLEEQPSGGAKDGNKSQLGLKEAAKEKQEEKGPHFSPPSFVEEESPHVPAEGADEKGTFVVEEKRQMPGDQPTKSCAGVCQVRVQTSRKTGWKDTDGDAKQEEPEDFEALPSEKRASAEVPGEDAMSKRNDIKGEGGTHLSYTGGQEEAELRVKRSPESIHRQRMEEEILKEHPESLSRMRNLPRRLYFYNPYRGYFYGSSGRVSWYPEYGSIYWAPAYYGYYPLTRYGRWLREDTSEAKEDVDRSGQAPERRTSGLISHVYSEGMNRNAGLDCPPGSSCSKMHLNTHPLAPFSDDVRLLEHQQNALDAHHLGTDRKYPYISVY